MCGRVRTGNNRLARVYRGFLNWGIFLDNTHHPECGEATRTAGAQFRIWVGGGPNKPRVSGGALREAAFKHYRLAAGKSLSENPDGTKEGPVRLGCSGGVAA